MDVSTIPLNSGQRRSPEADANRLIPNECQPMGPSGQSIRSMSRNQHEHVSPSCEREPRRGHLRTRAGFNRQAETPPWIRSGTVVELNRCQVEQDTA